MKISLRCIAVAVAGVALSACVAPYAHTVTAAAPASAGTPITADASSTGFLLLDAPPPAIVPELLRVCPSGKIPNLETESSARNWFGIVQRYRVTARGTCLQ